MTPLLAFRISVIAAPVLSLLAALYTLIATPYFSQDWQDLLAWSMDGSVFPECPSEEEELPPLPDLAAFLLSGLALVLFGLVAVANQIALYFFWPPSRPIYLALCLVGFTLTPLMGLFVSPPLEMLGMELSIFISGITLAMAYFCPEIADRFVKKAPAAQTEPPSLPTTN